ncbi:unnamed protein product [Natator depressus]
MTRSSAVTSSRPIRTHVPLPLPVTGEEAAGAGGARAANTIPNWVISGGRRLQCGFPLFPHIHTIPDWVTGRTGMTLVAQALGKY